MIKQLDRFNCWLRGWVWSFTRPSLLLILITQGWRHTGHYMNPPEWKCIDCGFELKRIEGENNFEEKVLTDSVEESNGSGR